MSKIINFYGEETGINELILEDFNVNYRLEDKGNFYKIIKRSKNISLKKELLRKNGIIIFYSPNCTKCKDSIDFWTEIAINNFYNFSIYAVNCDNLVDNNDYLLPLLKIEHYPSYYSFDKKRGIINKLDVKTNLEDILFYISNNS